MKRRWGKFNLASFIPEKALQISFCRVPDLRIEAT